MFHSLIIELFYMTVWKLFSTIVLYSAKDEVCELFFPSFFLAYKLSNLRKLSLKISCIGLYKKKYI